jgi:hypothetical protein
MNKIVTIGVYGFDAESFFTALQRAGVDTLCDLRRRRGVRGSEYAFANRARLEARLARWASATCIASIWRRVPRCAQHSTASMLSKASPNASVKRFPPAFAEGYQRECLDAFDSRQFAADLGEDARVVALLCVETAPAACHRSLVAAQLAADLGLKVEHLLPDTKA